MNTPPKGSGTHARLPGRELQVRIDSIDKGNLDEASRANGFALASEQLNAGVIQPVASADESAGIVHIAFGHDSSVWPFAENRPFPPTRILVALYDKNRQLLTHFTTQEAFVPHEFVGNFPVASETLLAEGNQLQYPVNGRDLAFAEHILIGFETGPVVIDRRERLRSIMVPPIKQRWAEAMKPLEEELSRLRTTYRIGNSFEGDEETGSSNRLANAKRDLEELKEAHASRQTSLLEREKKWRKDLDTLLESKRQAEARGQWFSQQWNLETAQQRLAIVEKEKEELRLIEQNISSQESAMPDLAAACTVYKDTWHRLRDIRKQEEAELKNADAEILRTINAK
ncbi:MAG: hypothetical protein A49_28480 [Methyloceanibacter sp.]|nr:MAG: hypothetical protein A49_28480 [Methyloceanibacter sp.]